jgi:hypothetical protein
VRLHRGGATHHVPDHRLASVSCPTASVKGSATSGRSA